MGNARSCRCLNDQMQLRAVPTGSTDFKNPMSNVTREVLGGLRLNRCYRVVKRMC
jgi:hypothetical protein